MAQSNNALVGYGLGVKEPKLADVLTTWKRALLVGLNCVKVGSIAAFYPTTFTADVTLLFGVVLKDGTTSTYPQLLNCPVFTLQGGGASVQLPITIGDTCLVIFSDRNLDAWEQNGKLAPPLDGRAHDLSDAIALVGLNWSSDKTIPHVSSTEARFILKDGTTKVGLQSGKITVQNATQNLKTIMDTLLAAMAAATTVGQIASAAATAQTSVDALLY